MILTGEKQSIGRKKNIGNSTLSTKNVTAGPKPVLSGQRPVAILSHAWPLKAEVNTNCIGRSSPYRQLNTLGLNTRHFMLYSNVASGAAFWQIYVACVPFVFLNFGLLYIYIYIYFDRL